MYAGEEERQAAIPPPLEQDDQDQKEDSDNQLAEEETKEKPAEAQDGQKKYPDSVYLAPLEKITCEVYKEERRPLGHAVNYEKVKPMEYYKPIEIKPEPILEPLKLEEPLK